jgi:hypothetical protein
MHPDEKLLHAPLRKCEIPPRMGGLRGLALDLAVPLSKLPAPFEALSLAHTAGPYKNGIKKCQIR